MCGYKKVESSETVGEKGKIVVEFYGPFREYGKGLELAVENDLTFNELLEALEERLGLSFMERACKENSTYIVNNRIINRRNLDKIRISPGDRVAFALLIGGG
jgi:molybdopterin converting factor small subunit